MVRVGDRIGDYDIVARLKAGGMATLFLGRRGGADGFYRHVAVKVVHPHLAGDDQFVRMFLDEAKLSARIDHPNVVHVEELGQTGDAHYLVMEYVDGGSLAQLFDALTAKGRGLTASFAVAIAMRVADGLHAAHETRAADGSSLGVVHRDVSPQNILLSHRGHVTLIDFGIAKARGRAHETRIGAVKGKLRYMAPEQARGGDIDRRTDVYALGVVLWEMLTHRPYVDAREDQDVFDLVRNPRVRSAADLAPGISAALDAVVMRALAPDPDARPATALELRRELAAAEPAALGVDFAALAGIVEALIGDEIERSRRALPEEVSMALGPRTAVHDAPELLRAYTVGEGESPPPPGALTQTGVPSPQVLTETGVAAGAFGEPPPPRRGVPLALAAGAVALLGATLGLVVGLSIGGDRVTEPPPVASAPEAPASVSPGSPSATRAAASPSPSSPSPAPRSASPPPLPSLPPAPALPAPLPSRASPALDVAPAADDAPATDPPSPRPARPAARPRRGDSKLYPVVEDVGL